MSKTTAPPSVEAVCATFRLADLRDNIFQAQAVLDGLFEERKTAVKAASAAGVSLTEISETLGVSRTMVWKILDLPRIQRMAN